MGASMGPWPGHRPRGPSAPLRLRHSARRPLSWRKPQKTLPCQNEESDPRRQKRTALSEVDPADQQEAIRLPTRRREQRPSLPLLKRKRTGRGTSRAPCRSYGEVQIGFASTTAALFSRAIPHTTGRPSSSFWTAGEKRKQRPLCFLCLLLSDDKQKLAFINAVYLKKRNREGRRSSYSRRTKKARQQQQRLHLR